MKPRNILWTALITLQFAVPTLAMAATDGDGTCGGVAVGTKGLSKLCNSAGGGGQPIYALLGAAINYLIYIISAVAVLAIIISGVQYITSQGEPDAIKKAKSRITNAVISLILLSLTFVIMKFLGVSN